MKGITTAALAAAALLAATTAHAETALTRIDRALATGRIDAPTHALYQVEAILAPEQLPLDLQPLPGDPAERVRCGTPIVHHAWMLRGQMSADQQATLASLLGRPALPNTLVSTANTIVVHYANGDAAVAAQVLAAADNSWTTEVDTMGWAAPLDDTSAAEPAASYGGTGDLDIYLAAPSNGAGGLTIPVGSDAASASAISDASTFIEIDPTDPNIETYVAHEFNHASQFSYDAIEADLVYEATAVFMEDQVYPAVNDYFQYVADFQNKPFQTLSYASYSDAYMYGAALWLEYLSHVHDSGGVGLVKSIWVNSEQTDAVNSKTYFDALAQNVLPGAGLTDVMAMYAEFAGYRSLTNADSDGSLGADQPSWDAIPAEATYTLANAKISGASTSHPPEKLAANYVSVDTSNGATGDSLTFSLHGTTGVAWAVTTVKIPVSGAASVSVARDSGDGNVTASVGSTVQWRKVYFVVSNLGIAGQEPDSSAGGGHTADLTTTPVTYDLGYDAKAKSACGCTTTGATPPLGGALGLLVVVGAMRRRRKA